MERISKAALMLVLGAVIMWTVVGNPDTLAQSNSGHKRIEDDKKKLEVFDFREKDLLRELSQIEKEIANKKEEIADIEKRLRALGKKSSELRQILSEMEVSRKKLERKLAKSIVCLYKYGRRGYMRALCTAKDLDSFRRRANYLSRLMEQDRKALDSIFSQQSRLTNKLTEIKKEINSTDALRGQEQAKLAALKEDVEKKVIHLMRIHEEKEFYSSAVRELESIGSGFKETIVKVEDRRSDEPLELTNISQLKGKLSLPLVGTVVRGKKLFGSNRVHLDKGIFIRARAGAKVRAILPGRVEYSGQLKGYGQVIIINHGSRFFTVSALLGKRDKEEGELVREGEVIGEVGRVSKGLGPSLYFEIRKGGKNLDPLRWLRIRG